jgi:hypothetical protein
MTHNPKQAKPNSRRSVWFVLLFVVLVVSCFSLVRGCRRNRPDPAASMATGTRFEFDDFYHATAGTWELETPVDLLKARKYVSGTAERDAYRVYAAQPGEVVTIRNAMGRWKELAVLKDGLMTATGWADVNTARARRLP